MILNESITQIYYSLSYICDMIINYHILSCHRHNWKVIFSPRAGCFLFFQAQFNKQKFAMKIKSKMQNTRSMSHQR